MHETETEAADLTAPQVMSERWGSGLPDEGLQQRFTEPGWTYQEQLPRAPADEGRSHDDRP
ncbi:hypothetical protein [Kitasatospora sp. NPDC085464]|uniref:hypothetical protein n=1 Tax=Kitasatospora sp. NPDC085464 TaxID=3364063 RepID=UPI0037C90574